MSILEGRVGTRAGGWVRRVEVLRVGEVRGRLGLLVALRRGLSGTSGLFIEHSAINPIVSLIKHVEVGAGSEGRQRRYPHGFALSASCVLYIRNASSSLRQVLGVFQGRLTPRIAGSLGMGGGAGLGSSTLPSILRSFTSLPRKTMYS